jgi:hypothetical protein
MKANIDMKPVKIPYINLTQKRCDSIKLETQTNHVIIHQKAVSDIIIRWIMTVAVACLFSVAAHADNRTNITVGGTYSGTWTCTDPNAAAVTISTTSPVTITNSTITSCGNGITTGVGGVNLTVKNTIGNGANPLQTGYASDHFIWLDSAASLDVENCTISGGPGIEVNFVQSYTGPIKILKNKVHNINGAWSLGAGGGYSTNQFDLVQFVQLSNCGKIPGVEIAWNQIIEDPGASRVEDNINIYHSGGTSSSDILIHDNYIHGAYEYNPSQDEALGYSGGGIMCDEGATNVYVYSNQVVNTGNYGVSIAGGTNNYLYNNRVVSCGTLGDGTYIATDYGDGAANWNTSISADNIADYNTCGLLRKTTGGTWERADFYLPSQSSDMSNVDFPHDPTLQDETNEWTTWTQKLSANGITVGAAAYTITASAGANGSITPSGAVPVLSGANQTFTIAANSGYTNAGVTVDGTSVGTVSSYTFNNVTANHTISASFGASGGGIIGYNGTGASSNDFAAGDMGFCRFQAGANLTVSTMFIKVQTSVSAPMKMAIYSDSSGKPKTFLKGTNERTNPGTGWQSFTLTSSQSLTSGTYYWLTFWVNGSYYFKGENSGGTSKYGSHTYGASWPSPPSLSTESFLHCIYAQ